MRSALKWPGHPALLLLLLALAGLGSGGCVTAGLAAVGPILGSITAIGDRTVERTIPADLSTTWGATVDALARMAVRVEETEKSGTRWRLTGIEDGVTVYGTLERVTASMTKVSIRVEAGSLYADKRTGEELLNQVGASLASLTGTGPRDVGASEESMARLQRAVDRLGTRVEEARDGRDGRRPSSNPEASSSSPTVTASPIITVPTSAAVATVPGPVPVLAGPRPVPVLRREEHEGVPPGSALERQKHWPDEIMARPLTSVEVLSPVESLTTRPVGR
jgi:uncharacterized protein DUF3568